MPKGQNELFREQDSFWNRLGVFARKSKLSKVQAHHFRCSSFVALNKTSGSKDHRSLALAPIKLDEQLIRYEVT